MQQGLVDLGKPSPKATIVATGRERVFLDDQSCRSFVHGRQIHRSPGVERKTGDRHRHGRLHAPIVGQPLSPPDVFTDDGEVAAKRIFLCRRGPKERSARQQEAKGCDNDPRFHFTEFHHVQPPFCFGGARPLVRVWIPYCRPSMLRPDAVTPTAPRCRRTGRTRPCVRDLGRAHFRSHTPGAIVRAAEERSRPDVP